MPINGIDHSPGPLSPDPSPKHVGESRDVALSPSARMAGADRHLTPLQDRVEISQEARSLSSHSIAEVGGRADISQIDDGTGEITTERVQTILQRLRKGFYDLAQVQGQVAERLLPDVQLMLT